MEPASGVHRPFGAEPFLHFDLGVDALASSSEIDGMSEPWLPGQRESAAAEPVSASALPALQAPAPELGAWAAGLQLPGV